jgi:hypothetical protein
MGCSATKKPIQIYTITRCHGIFFMTQMQSQCTVCQFVLQALHLTVYFQLRLLFLENIIQNFMLRNSVGIVLSNFLICFSIIAALFRSEDDCSHVCAAIAATRGLCCSEKQARQQKTVYMETNGFGNDDSFH